MVLIEECKHDKKYMKVDEDINHAVDRTEAWWIPSLIIYCGNCGVGYSSWYRETPESSRFLWGDND